MHSAEAHRQTVVGPKWIHDNIKIELLMTTIYGMLLVCQVLYKLISNSIHWIVSLSWRKRTSSLETLSNMSTATQLVQQSWGLKPGHLDFESHALCTKQDIDHTNQLSLCIKCSSGGKFSCQWKSWNKNWSHFNTMAYYWDSSKAVFFFFFLIWAMIILSTVQKIATLNLANEALWRRQFTRWIIS